MKLLLGYQVGLKMRMRVLISKIRIRIMLLSFLGIRISVHTIIKCGYYPLSAYEILSVLNYYINLYARLTNVVIIICKLKEIKNFTCYTIYDY
jgi:hypothetical protein